MNASAFFLRHAKQTGRRKGCQSPTDHELWPTNCHRSSGSATTYACKVSVIASSTGLVTQLDTEDYNPGGEGLIGLAGALGAYGILCGQRLGMKPLT
jgi:hypothetical protein